MAAILTESQIKALLDDVKKIHRTYRRTLAPRRSKKGRQNELGWRLNTTGESGKKYRIYTRRSKLIENNFSIGLLYLESATKHYTLIRCNGWHGPHTNIIEGDTIPEDTCHIHFLTERYQQFGHRGDHFAVATNEYRDFKSALEFFVANYGICLRGRPRGKERPLLD